MGALVFGGALLQWPIGRLSDLADRRVVIAMITFATGIAAVGASLMAGMDLPWFLVIVGLFGGLAFSIHALCIAYTNDHLEPTEYVGASSGLVLILGTGSIVGPLAVGAIMGGFGPAGFFWWLALVCLAVTALALWRMTRRESPPNEEQGPFIAMTTQASPVAIAAAEEVHAEELQSG
jgi:MFS family permease